MGAIIISVVFGGLTAIFVNVRRYVLHANRRLVATNLSRQTLNGLYQDVRADTWNTGNLSVGTHAVGNVNIDNSNYTANDYTVAPGPDIAPGIPSQYRQVGVRINYEAD